MENIFENAYFGKAYKTRDGSKAIFICKRTDNSVWDLNHPYACVVEGFGEIWNYFPNGQLYIGEKFITESDIVSEWQEPIDEEKLNKEFDNFVNSNEFRSLDTPYFYFKAGYRKAMKGGEV